MATKIKKPHSAARRQPPQDTIKNMYTGIRNTIDSHRTSNARNNDRKQRIEIIRALINARNDTDITDGSYIRTQSRNQHNEENRAETTEHNTRRRMQTEIREQSAER